MGADRLISVKFDEKNNHIYIKYGVSNVYPLCIAEGEYMTGDVPFNEKLYGLAIALIRGDFKAKAGSKYDKLARMAQEAQRTYCPIVSVERDFALGKDYVPRVDNITATYFVEQLLTERMISKRVDACMSDLVQMLQATNKDAETGYKKTYADMSSKGVRFVTCAWNANSRENVICIVPDARPIDPEWAGEHKDFVYLAQEDQYDGMGHLYDKENPAICLGEYSSRLVQEAIEEY